MDPQALDPLHAWLKAAHLIGVFIWIGSMFVVYWLLRFHAHAPKDAHEKLLLSERSMALMMDIGATLAMACGIALIFNQPVMVANIFAQKPAGWFHIKLTIIVLGLLSSHGMLRARIKKFSEGKIAAVPSWMWSVILLSVVSILIVVFVVRGAMVRAAKEDAAKTPTSLIAPVQADRLLS